MGWREREKRSPRRASRSTDRSWKACGFSAEEAESNKEKTKVLGAKHKLQVTSFSAALVSPAHKPGAARGPGAFTLSP